MDPTDCHLAKAWVASEADAGLRVFSVFDGLRLLISSSRFLVLRVSGFGRPKGYTYIFVVFPKTVNLEPL